MEHSDLALLERRKGNEAAALDHLSKAMELESQAANALIDNINAEPTRSVLFRSAATLARDCSQFGVAEKLIHKALAGNPPDDVAEELRDLLEQVTFERHLALRGVALSDDEFQMALTGKSVGLGLAPTDMFLRHVQSTENLLYRTAERKQGRAYRDRGRRDEQLAQNLECYITVPRAASFAVTFRIGGAKQPSLPGLSLGEEVIDELLECLDLYTEGKEGQLKDRIPEEAYYRNFIGLAQSVQPDGDKINMVGFTTVRRGKLRQVALKQPKGAPPNVEGTTTNVAQSKKKLDQDPVAIRGTLMIANATKKSEQKSGEIEIVTAEGRRVKIIVPPGMMSDIVKPLWESEVDVLGTRKGKQIHLMQIKEAF